MSNASFEFEKFGIFVFGIIALLAIMIGASHVLGPRKSGKADQYPFESGIIPAHDTDVRFPAKFYIVAMLFVIFDLEMIFVLAWAVSARLAGWVGYGAIVAFLTFLLIALGYLWRSDALAWGPRPRFLQNSGPPNALRKYL